MTMNALEQLKKHTRVVADTGDFESMTAYRPVDATTNPSLIFAAARQEKYHHLAAKAATEAKALSNDNVITSYSIHYTKLYDLLF